MFEIRVEGHGQIADENAAEPSGADFAVIEEHEAVLFGWFEPMKLFCEMLVKIDAEFAGDFVLDDDGVAEQAADDGAAYFIFVGKLITAHGGEAALGDGFLPARDVAEILRVGVLNAADGSDAHTVEVSAGFGSVALEIAVEGAVLLGYGELVAGLREVVHADVEIAGLDELEQAGTEDIEFLHPLRKVGGEGALLLFQPGHVGVAKERNAIGSEADDLIHGVGERVGGLMGKAIDQIDIDAVKAEFARGKEEVAGHFVGLNAVDGLLHLGLEILNAHAETVESELAKSFEVLAGSYAGVDFDADLAVGVKMEMVLCEGEEVFDLLGREVGRCAAAPMELNDRAIPGDAAADALHFLLQDVEIGRSDTFVFLDDYVAGAEEAKALAEGDMHVERDGRAGKLGFFVDSFEIGGAEGVVPDRGRRVASVTRSGAIVFGEEVLSDMKLAAHLVETWMSECHAVFLSRLRHGVCVLNQSVLGSFDKDLSVFHGRVLQDAMAEVEDMAVACQGVDGG